MDWQWAADHVDEIAELTKSHLYLALMPVLWGLLIAVPLGVLCVRLSWLYPPVFGVVNVLYALPALALFVLLLDFTGFSNATIIIPLTIYTLVVLVPNVVDGLRGVPEPVRQAATAMGFGQLRRLVQVELPIAIPVIMAGLRIATVSSISLVSVGVLIGQDFGGLGDLFIDGFQKNFMTPLIIGVVLIVLLALAADALLVVAQRFLTPWSRTRVVRGRTRARVARRWRPA
ncbi:MAG TPA: ABC transporter permease [Actinomycetes bacterium]|nr:ABC transporter permease [Actinomycetes bacterium]